MWRRRRAQEWTRSPRRGTQPRTNRRLQRRGLGRETYAAANNVPFATGDADQVISDPEIDAVYVASPPNTHEEYTVAAAEAGKPVLVEKPMGRSVSEARAMIEACDRHDVELFVAYYRRFHPQVVKMRELLEANAIGDPDAGGRRLLFPDAGGQRLA